MPQLNKNLLIITTAMFWRSGAGYWARTRATINYLAQHIHLTVIYPDPVTQEDRSAITTMSADFTFISLEKHDSENLKTRIKSLRTIIRQSPEIDFFLIDKAENTYVLDALPAQAIKILDTHDLVHKRNNSLQQFGITDNFILTARQERDLFNHFQAILCIQKDDYNTVIAWHGNYACLHVPHPVKPTPQQLAETVTRIGIIASGWHANVRGLDYFIQHIWPALAENLALHIYGYVAEAFRHLDKTNIYAHGFEHDLTHCYRNIDIAINPVYYGAGLKIKTIEAMAHGIPLVTTQQGATGLHHLSGKAFLLANSDEEFIQHIKLLMSDQQTRNRISQFAQAYTKNHLNEKQCFKPLMDFINSFP